MQQIFRYVAGVALVVGLPLGHGSAIAQQAAAPAPAPAAAAPVETLPPSIPASQFAARPAFWDAKLSPNGVMMAFMRYKDGNPIFVISDTVSGKLAGAVALEPSDDFEWYRWVGDGKLLLSVSTPGDFFGDEVRYTRLFLFEVSTGALTRLFSRSTVVENDNVIHVAKDG